MSRRPPGALFLIILSAQLTLGLAQDAPRLNREAQDSSQDRRDIRLYVKRIDGVPIPGAQLTIDGSVVSISDSGGTATLTCQPGVMPPILLEVHAAGFKAQSVMIHDLDLPDKEVVLRRYDPVRRIMSGTVRVNELTREVQENSVRLQNQGLAAIRRREYVIAEQLFHTAMELTPSSYAIYNNIGVVYARQNDITEAGTWFEKALAIVPHNALVSANLGLIRWAQDRREESYTLLHWSLSRGYSSPSAHYALGILSLQKGLSAEAAKHLKKTKPGEFRYRDLFLSFAQRSMGKLDAGMKSYWRFLRSSPAPLVASSGSTPHN